MHEQRIDEIVREVENEHPRWVLIQGQSASLRTRLARRLVVAAVHELSDKLHEFVPGFTAQVLWYSREDQEIDHAQHAMRQLALVVREAADVDMVEPPVTYVPMKYDPFGSLSEVVARNVLGRNVVCAVFDDIWPGRSLCDAFHRRMRSRDIGVLITTTTDDSTRADGLSASVLADYGWFLRDGHPLPWKACRLER